MKHIKQCILLILISLIAEIAYANTKDTTNPYFDINRVIGTLANTPFSSFTSTCYYEEVTSTGTMRDTLTCQYQINGRKYRATTANADIIQNEQYNITINKADSLILVGRAKNIFPAVMQADILDSTLNAAYLSKIVCSDIGSVRKLNFIFRPDAPILSYELQYDTVSARLKAISYKLRPYNETVTGAQQAPSGNYVLLVVLFTDYQLNAFTDAVFDISMYLSHRDGAFTVQPAYSGFEIINQVINP